jgi:CRP/FNR family transcriptional regulator, cyclic AMP receptor protein
MSIQSLTAPTEGKLRSLSLVDIFEPLSTEEIARLNSQLTDIHLERDEIFYSPENPNEKLFVLRSGRVRIYKADDDQELTLDMVDAGTVFGEMALTAQRLRGTYAQAMEPSDISVMSCEQLEGLILEKPEVGVQIVHLLAVRLRQYEIRLEDITLKDVLTRLASLILSLIDKEGVVIRLNQLKIPNHYTHEQLGTMIGAKRAAVTRAFARLQDEGAVELRRRLIHVVDVEALRGFARHRRDGEEQTL